MTAFNQSGQQVGVQINTDLRRELDIIHEFVERVEARAEAEMQRTHTLEGAHYRAMKAEVVAMERRAAGR